VSNVIDQSVDHTLVAEQLRISVVNVPRRPLAVHNPAEEILPFRDAIARADGSMYRIQNGKSTRWVRSVDPKKDQWEIKPNLHASPDVLPGHEYFTGWSLALYPMFARSWLETIS
jgi:hypothetical protein